MSPRDTKDLSHLLSADGGLPDRFWAKVDKSGDCWEWTANKNGGGYGRIKVGGEMVVVHRLAYESMVGHIPVGLFVDHLCRNRSCVNPAHMELVTFRENVLRGVGPTAENARRPTCIRGHEFVSNGRGGRRCPICQAMRSAKHEAKKATR